MSAFGFLIRRTFRNRLLQIIRKPSMVILSILLIAVVLMGVFSMSSSTAQGIPGMNPQLLSAGMLALYVIITYYFLKTALKEGATAFSMADVQFLFPAPLRSQNVLLYGGVRQLGTAAMVMVFALLQMVNIRNLFGAMTWPAVAVLYVTIFLVILVPQTIGLALYALTSEHDGLRRKLLRALDLLVLLLLLLGALPALRAGSLQALLDSFASPLYNWVPLAGWLRGAMGFALGGQYLYAIGLMVASLLLAVVVFVILWRKNPDYYEDVLGITQVQHDRRQDKLAGKQEFGLRRNIKVDKGGIGHGQGATVLFFRQVLEGKRQGHFFFDVMTIIMIGSTAFMTFIMLRAASEDGGMSPEVPFFTALAAIVYMQMIFAASTGSFQKEISKPMFNLFPDTPQRKVIFSNLQPSIKAFLDGLLAMLACLAIAQDLRMIPMVFSAALLIGTTNLLFSASSLVMSITVGQNLSKTIATMLYMIASMFLISPCVVIVVVMMLVFPQAGMVALLLGCVYNLAVFAAVTLLLGGLLHRTKA